MQAPRQETKHKEVPRRRLTGIQPLALVLRNRGDSITRENLMKQAKSLKDVRAASGGSGGQTVRRLLFGTFKTFRGDLTMSVHRGRPEEVTGRRSNALMDPEQN